MDCDDQQLDMTFKADSAERLLGPAEPLSAARRRRFAILLAICFLIHAALVAILFHEDRFEAATPTQEQEIPVEVVVLPPEEKPPPQKPQKKLPPPPDLVTPPIVKPKPPPEKVQLEDVEVAHDAPMAANSATTAKGTPDTETKAPRNAPPPKLMAPKPKQNQPEQEKEEAAAQEKPDSPSAPPKPADANPDAEPLDKAQPDQPKKPKEKPAPQESKKPPTQGKKVTVAQQLAALSPSPNFSLGSTAKSAPIAGGTEKASYESLLFGLIKRQMRFPPGLRGRHMSGGGMVSLYVDEMGHLTHQAVYRASGAPDLDAAWLEAVRRAAPFPPPPRGLPHAFILGYPIAVE